MEKLITLEQHYKDSPELKTVFESDVKQKDSFTNDMYGLSKKITKKNIPYSVFIQAFNPKDQFANFKNFRDQNKDYLKEKYNTKDVESIDKLLVAKEAFDSIRKKYGAEGEMDFKGFARAFAPEYEQKGEYQSIKDYGIRMDIKDIPEDELQNYFKPKKYDDEEVAKRLGMSLETEAQFPRLAASYFNDQARAKQTLEIQLKDRFKKLGAGDFDLNIAPDPYTAREMYTNPLNGNREFINPPILEIADIKAFQNTAIDVVQDLGAYYGARGLGYGISTFMLKPFAKKLGDFLGSRAMQTIYGAGSVGYANAHRQARKIAEGEETYRSGFGINPETKKPFTEKEKKSIYKQSLALELGKDNFDELGAGLTVVADLMFPAYKFYKVVTGGGKFDEAAKQYLKEAFSKNEAERVYKQILEDASVQSLKDRLTLSLGEATGDGPLLAHQADMLGGTLGENVSREFALRDEVRNEAMGELLKGLSGVYTKHGMNSEKFGRAMQEIFLKRKNEDTKFLINKLANSTDNLINQKILTPGGSTKQVGDDISTVISDLRIAVKDSFNTRYDALFDETGFGGKDIDFSGYYDEVVERYQFLSKSAEKGKRGSDASLDAIQKQYDLPDLKSFPDLYKKLKGSFEGGDATPKSIKVTADDVGESYNMVNWHESLKSIRDKISDPMQSPVAVQQLKKIETRLLDSLHNHPTYGASKFRRQYDAISEGYKKDFIAKYNKNITKNFFKNEAGELTINGEDVFKTIFKNENSSSINVIQDIKDFHKFAKETPDIFNRTKTLIIADMFDELKLPLLKNKMLNDGIESITKTELQALKNGFAKYADDHQTAFQLFLGKDVTDKTRIFSKRIDGLIENMKASEQMTTKLKQKFDLPDNFTVEDAFYTSFDSKYPSRTSAMMNLLKNNPEMTDAYRSSVLLDMQDKVFSKNGVFSEIDFISYWDKYSQNFKKAFVDGAKKDSDSVKLFNQLDNFRTYVDMTTATGKNSLADKRIINQSLKKFIEYRIAPPLSPSGRLFHSVIDRVGMQVSGRMKEILIDPDLMGRYNQLIASEPGSETAQQIFTELFGHSLRNLKKELDKENNQGTYIGGERTEEEIIKETEKGRVPISREIEPQTRLSQQPINVAQMDMPPAQTTNVASAPVTNVDNPQGIAALPQGQGSGTTAPGSNAQTIARMEQFGSPFFNRG